jgi:hypothetical protein
MFGINPFGQQEQYVNVLEKALKVIDKIHTKEDFLQLFSNYERENVTQLNSISGSEISLYDSNKDIINNNSKIYLLEWKIIHKRFRILFCETMKGPFISFLIPYHTYSEWVAAEFRIERGEYSGERGQLNPTVNPNGKMIYYPNSAVNYPVVFLTCNSGLLNNLFLTETLIKEHFSNPEL